MTTFLRNSNLRGRGLDEFEAEQVGAAAQVVETVLAVALLIIVGTWILTGPPVPQRIVEKYGNLAPLP